MTVTLRCVRRSSSSIVALRGPHSVFLLPGTGRCQLVVFSFAISFPPMLTVCTPSSITGCTWAGMQKASTRRSVPRCSVQTYAERIIASRSLSQKPRLSTPFWMRPTIPGKTRFWKFHNQHPPVISAAHRLKILLKAFFLPSRELSIKTERRKAINQREYRLKLRRL